jgi:hypothetical protein
LFYNDAAGNLWIELNFPKKLGVFMAATTVKGFFTEHFVSPASATWSDLQNGAQNSITRADISGYLWNSLVCCAPLVAGGATAYAINKYAHQHLVRKLPFKSANSLICTTLSFIAGASVSFLAVRLLSASGGTLFSFTADKAIRLETLNVVMLAAATPISAFFGTPLLRFFQVPLFLRAAAVSGYFGERSLYVIGTLSSLTFAVHASLPRLKKRKQKPSEPDF